MRQGKNGERENEYRFYLGHGLLLFHRILQQRKALKYRKGFLHIKNKTYRYNCPVISFNKVISV